jgi:Stage II sporulation protein E (SpoIIE)
MVRTVHRLVVGLSLLGCGVLGPQTAGRAAPDASNPIQITFGQSEAPLYGPWRFSVGDSPVDAKTGRPLWAEPDFDDSKWENVDLTPKGDIDAVTAHFGMVPGWTARGHTGYSGYAWYRIRVQARSQAGHSLALAGPASVDDAYQLFADGSLLGSFGDFTGSHPRVYWTRPVLFHLPEPSSSSGGVRVLAFRVWMEPSTLADAAGGGMRTAPVLGESGVVALRYREQLGVVTRSQLSRVVLAAVYGLLSMVAFSLIFFDRSDPVYLWIGLFFLVYAVYCGSVVIAVWTELLSSQWYLVILGAIGLLSAGLWAIVLWTWFGRTGFHRLPIVVTALTALGMLTHILGGEIFYGLISHHAAKWFELLDQTVPFVFFALLVWITVQGIRLRGVEGWLVLPVVLLYGFRSIDFERIGLHVRDTWFPFGIALGLGMITNLLIAVVIALLLFRRLLQSVKRQREMALDVKSAQEVHRVILPEQRVVLPGFEIESEYRPAREVGGDFFQIIPDAADGSLLIVAGDVTGKGLQAGMMVAVLVGATRTAASFTRDPAEVLCHLNERLLGRGDAGATCLAMRIAADGATKLANSGHLPPYLNGSPVEIEGSLPLGMFASCEPSVLEFRLAPGDRLVLVSDGVAEAMDEKGNLFGFERVMELVSAEPSARQIAEAAQGFGQSDDISVISVARVGVVEPALA